MSAWDVSTLFEPSKSVSCRMAAGKAFVYTAEAPLRSIRADRHMHSFPVRRSLPDFAEDFRRGRRIMALPMVCAIRRKKSFLQKMKFEQETWSPSDKCMFGHGHVCVCERTMLRRDELPSARSCLHRPMSI